jgi:peptide-methionine (S)-S-oxide reductase
MNLETNRKYVRCSFMKHSPLLFFVILNFFFSGCTNAQKPESLQANLTTDNNMEYEKITLGAGCFWCVEAIFLETKGVYKVVSGYMGGSIKNPSYKEVCTGTTGHAEVVQISYNPEEIKLDEILEIFWQTHDPTTLNRQGADVGTQYRSAVFFHNQEQQTIALELKEKLNAEKIYDKPIITEISEASEFYIAEDYHQNYYNQNENQPYCSFVITPKLEKFRKVFADKRKETNLKK